MNSIPTDLILEILLKLPAKSIARFRCVSKLWSSMIHRPYFTELFLTRSLARPRILLAIEQSNVWYFFSVIQRQSTYLVVPAEFHTKFPRDNMRVCCMSCRQFSCGYASGLIYFSDMYMSETETSKGPVICNPNTGQYVTLPKLIRYRKSYSFLGFDPVDKEYKVLFMAYPYCDEGGNHRILTLGSGEMRWRNIKCSLTNVPITEGICINGILYYVAESSNRTPYFIVCFDVRSEKFTFIKSIGPDSWHVALINYKGKLCEINWKDGYSGDDVELHVMILMDVEKQEWSKHDYTLQHEQLNPDNMCCIGVDAMTGETVFSMNTLYETLYVFFYNPEKNTRSPKC